MSTPRSRPGRGCRWRRCRRRCTKPARLRARARRRHGVSAHPDQARRSDLAGPRRQQGAQARIPRRRCARAGCDDADHDRRGAIESRAHDGRGGVRGRHALCAGTDGDDRRSRDRRQPAARQLYGATIRLVPSIDPMLAVGQDEAIVAEVVAEERAAGRVPYVIPVGGSSGIGVCGYVGGSAELVDQLARRRHRAVAVVLRQRLARHPGRADARREALRRAVSGLWGRGQRRRTGEDRAREANRERGRGAV